MRRRIDQWLLEILGDEAQDHIAVAKAKLVFYLPLSYALISTSSIPLMMYYKAWHVVSLTIISFVLLLSTPLVFKLTRSTFKTSMFFAIANLITLINGFYQTGYKLDFLSVPYFLIHIVIVAFLLSKRWTMVFTLLDVFVVTTGYILRQNGIYHKNALLDDISVWTPLFNFVILIILLVYILIKYIDVRTVILRSIRQTNEELQHQQEQSRTTNERLNQKNKDITDNMVYARRIQNALLDEESYVSKHLPDHFIYYLPKDIVSGDFYWHFQQGDNWYVAVADCTGHGVSGAFLSLLGMSYLNEVIKDNPNIQPSDVLEKLRTRFISVLGKREELIYSLDGMDIALIKVNLKTYHLEYSGAYNPLYLVRNGETLETKATKATIGHSIAMYDFANHEFQLEKGDVIYLFSDGYADQFGGEAGKKFSYHRLKKVASEFYNIPMEEQKNQLHKMFREWKGSRDQLDDICILGIRF